MPLKKIKLTLNNQGSLKKHGYSTKDLAGVRRKALKKSIHSRMRKSKMTRHDAAVSVVRRLTTLQVFHKNKKKRLSDLFRRDANWIRKNMY